MLSCLSCCAQLQNEPSAFVKGKIMENATLFLVGLVAVAVVVIVALMLRGGVSIGSLTLTMGKLVIKDLRISSRLEDSKNRKS